MAKVFAKNMLRAGSAWPSDVRRWLRRRIDARSVGLCPGSGLALELKSLAEQRASLFDREFDQG